MTEVKSEPQTPTPEKILASPSPEPESQYEPESEPTLFVKRNESGPSKCLSRSKPTFAWQQADRFGPLIEVETREKAVKAGIGFLRELNEVLRHHSKDVPSATKWIERIKTIMANRRETRILIGFLGTTGAGKSSMINALLEQEDLLPADDEKACTAVCVEISWNPRGNQDEAYVAKIERISEEDWRLELEKLFQDISDQALNKDGDDGEPDLERDMRIKTAFQKLKCVYPLIKTIADLKSYTVKNLLDHPNVKGVLGTTRTFIGAHREDFASQIKPFIDSSNSMEGGSSKSFAQWPLVKLVHLYVRSRVLEHGIILVDLPGSMDTNAARGAIAEAYQKNLSVNCVVARTSRAASDKPAQDLLGQISQRTLKLDGRFSADHLCFIVSMTDSSLNVPRYIKTHSQVEADLAKEFEKEMNLNKMLTTVNNICVEKKDSQTVNKKLVTVLNSELRKLGPAVKKMGGGRGTRQKRKRDDDVPAEDTRTPEEKATLKKYRELQIKAKEAKENADRDGNSLFQALEKIKALEQRLENCESRKAAVCIKNRNLVSATEIRKDFDTAARQMGRKGNGKPLQVFCVSSWAFTQLSNGGPPLLGFPKIQDSGIPNLQDWLGETTLLTRNRNALSFLEDIVSLELSMIPWLADTSVEFKMSGAQRNNVEDFFDKHFQSLNKDLSNANSLVVQRCESTVDKDLFSKMSKAEHVASANAEQIVKSWAQKPTHWGTHRATNRERGTWKNYKGVEIKWNDELAGSYLEPLVKEWDRTMHLKLPAQQTVYDEAISKIIQRFVKTVANSISEMCPDLDEPVQQWKESALRTMNPIQKVSRNIFEESIQEAARDSHRLVQPKIKELWAPVYDLCAAESGTGHFKRNQKAHVTHVQKINRQMYKKSSGVIRANFKKLWDGLAEEFDKGTKPATSQMRDEFEEMISNYTLLTDREVSVNGSSDSKAQLQERVRALFAKLKADWSEAVEVPIVEEELESDEEEIKIDDLINEEKGDDEYIELSDESGEDE